VTLTNIGWAIMQKFGFNVCVTIHELRLRMRGARPFWLMLGYTLLAASAVLFTYLIMSEPQQWKIYGSGPDSAEIGRTSFTVLSYVQLSLIVLILPALSAGAIAMEREKRTLELLRATLLGAFDIVSGKMLVVIAFTIVLLISTLPVASWSILLGGVEPREVGFIYSYLLSVGALIASIGFLMSVLLKRSLGAVIATYVALFVLLGVIPGVWFSIIEVFNIARYTGGSGPPTISIASAAVFTVAAIGLASWLLFLVVRWFLSKLSAWGRGKGGLVLAIVLALGLFGLANWQVTSPLATLFSGMEAHAPLVLHPFVTLAAIMYSEVGTEFFSTAGTGGTGAIIDPQPYIWGITVVFMWALALGLWAASVKLFQTRE